MNVEQALRDACADRIRELEAALVRIAGTGRIPPGSVKFPNVEYRAGYCCGYEDQADIAREVLTATNRSAE